MSKKNKDFSVFILSFGRSEKVSTYSALRKQGYTGAINIVCSDDDLQLDAYKSKFENVHVFSKKKLRGTFDIGDNFEQNNVVVFARNAVFEIAKKIGVKTFLVLDDDYKSFYYRIPQNKKLSTFSIENLDVTFSYFIEFIEKNKNVKCIAFAQAGDFIGGADNDFFNKGYVRKKRKMMNCFFFCTEKPVEFIGRINEDVNTYVSKGKIGEVFLTHPLVSIVQNLTQSNSGGLTEFYLETGTYIKSFYTLIMNPSCVRLMMMGWKDRRIHHKVKWEYAVPCIIRN